MTYTYKEKEIIGKLKPIPFSEIDFEKIAKYYRQKTEAKIKKIEDLKEHPNNILISYLISDQNLSIKEITEKIRKKNLSQLEEDLILQYNTTIFSILPKLLPGQEYGENPYEIGISLFLKKPDNYYIKYQDLELIIAKKNEQTYTFPSGRNERYILLTKEKTANLSILKTSFNDKQYEEIYIRKNSQNFLLALLRSTKRQKKFEPFKEKISQFKDKLAGIIITETLAQKESKDTIEMLSAEGIHPDFYEIYKLLIKTSKF